MLQYKRIEIFAGEESRFRGKPLSEAVLQYVSSLRIAARCIVTKGTDGSYESGEVATRKLEVLSFNMPVIITIIVPAPEADRILPKLEEMVDDGIVAVRDLDVVSYKTRSRLIPRHLRVRDAMTSPAVTVRPSTPVSEVVRLLLGSTFTGVPVVDGRQRPVGVISQGDLIYRAGMPIRLGLLAKSDRARADEILESLSRKKAEEIMTSPAVSIDQDKQLTRAVDLMLKQDLKRLPVVDASGTLTGILSLMDLFRVITRQAPDWRALELQNVVVNQCFVSDIMRRDTHAVLPETPIDEVIRLVCSNDIRRVAVVDENGRFLGLISDGDLLTAFSGHRAGFWDYYLMSKIPFTEMGRKHREFIDRLQAKTAKEVMDRGHITVREDATIEEAIGLMLEKGIRRIPVLDEGGSYKGMVSRESLLRTGFGAV